MSMVATRRGGSGGGGRGPGKSPGTLGRSYTATGKSMREKWNDKARGW